MGAALTRIVKVLQDISYFLNNPWGYCGVIFSSIFILIYQSIQNPDGAINTFMIRLIDLIIVIFPENPENYKIGTMLSNFYSILPSYIPTSAISEIMQGIGGMLAIFLVIKLYKMMPFT